MVLIESLGCTDTIPHLFKSFYFHTNNNKAFNPSKRAPKKGRKIFNFFKWLKMVLIESPGCTDSIPHLLKLFYFHTLNNKTFYPSKRALKKSGKIFNFFKWQKMVLIKSPGCTDSIPHLFKSFYFQTFNNRALYPSKRAPQKGGKIVNFFKRLKWF